MIAKSNSLISDIICLGFTKEFHDNIITNFKSDEIGDICRSNTLILKFEAMQFEKYGKPQNDLIRQSMRQLAWLTLSLRDLSKHFSRPLSDFLHPESVDNLIQATKNLAMVNTCDETSRPLFNTPSLALKLG